MGWRDDDHEFATASSTPLAMRCGPASGMASRAAVRGMVTTQLLRHAAVVLALLLTLPIWLFVGVEAVDYEHSTDYRLFLKQYPSWAIVYRNPVLCGECDLRRPENIGREANRRFETFCRVRFDLDPGLCYAIYAMDQRRADELPVLHHRAQRRRSGSA